MPTRKPGGYVDWSKVPAYNPAIEKGLDIYYLNYIQYPINSTVKKPHVPTLNKIDKLVYGGATQKELEDFLEVFIAKVGTDRRLTWDIIDSTIDLLNDLRRYVRTIFKNSNLLKKIKDTAVGMSVEQWEAFKARRRGGGNTSCTGRNTAAVAPEIESESDDLDPADNNEDLPDPVKPLLDLPQDEINAMPDVLKDYIYYKDGVVIIPDREMVDELMEMGLSRFELLRFIGIFSVKLARDTQLGKIEVKDLRVAQDILDEIYDYVEEAMDLPGELQGEGNCIGKFCMSASVAPAEEIEITDPSLNSYLDYGLVPSRDEFIKFIKEAGLSKDYVYSFLSQLSREVQSTMHEGKLDKLKARVDRYYEHLPRVQELQRKEQQEENTIAEQIKAVELKLEKLQKNRTKAAQAEADEAVSTLNELLSRSTKPRKYNFNELVEIQEFDKINDLDPEMTFYEELRDSPKFSGVSERVATGFKSARLNTEEQLAEEVEHQLALQKEAVEMEASIREEVENVVRALIGNVSNQSGDASGVGLF